MERAVKRRPSTTYTITPYVGSEAQTATTLTGTPPTTGTTITGLTPGTSYTFTVQASNPAGAGPSSESSAIVPQESIFGTSTPTTLDSGENSHSTKLA